MYCPLLSRQLSALFILFCFALPVWADTPVGPMNYQGRLLDNSGVPVTGSYNFSASVYNAATGGTLKYRELHNGVTVSDGVYSFLVGTKAKDAGDSTWSIELWSCCTDLYLEIAVNGETLSPRHRLAAAPYAYQSTLALTTNNALSLGGKPSSWFDSTLEAICVSGKGKWLELANGGAGACLGAGSSYPGNPTVNWSSLTTDNDFSHLDLTNANVAGINFYGANLQYTTFRNTTYRVQRVLGADLRNTVWDGAIALDTGLQWSEPSSTQLSGATFKNMDMSKWGISLSDYSMISAAYLSACPTWQISAGWECRQMRASGSLYFLAGSHLNFTPSSAAQKDGRLDIDDDKLDNLYMASTNFSYQTLTNHFTGSTLYQADLTGATLANAIYDDVTFTGVKFKNATLDNIVFLSTSLMSGGDFTRARMNNVIFENVVQVTNFTEAALKQVDFTSLALSDFTNAILTDVRVDSLSSSSASPYYTTFSGTRFYGNYHVQDHNNNGHLIYQNVRFLGTRLSGDFTGITFTGTVQFKYTEFDHLDLCAAVLPLVDTSAPHNDLATVTWNGPVECPNGDDVTGGTAAIATCNYQTRITPIAEASCTAGIP